MRRPRVLVISSLYPSERDPVYGIFIHRAVQALKSRGVDMRVVSPVPWSPRVLSFNPAWGKWADIVKSTDFEGVKIHRPAHLEIPVSIFRSLRGTSMSARLYPYLKKIKKKFDFNIIHSHNVTPDGFAGSVLGKLFHVRTVCSIRGSDINSYPHSSRILHWMTRYALKNTDAIVANNEIILQKAESIAKQKLSTSCIYNGVDRRLFNTNLKKKDVRLKHGLPVSGILVVFVGNCLKSKGFAELTEAFKLIGKRSKNIQLLVVGDGPMLPVARAMFEKEGLGGQVIYTGRVPQHEAAEYLLASDIFVLPSHNEGMPNAMLEAMTCGLPCVVTPVGGVSEIVEHEKNALIIPVGDVAKLVDAIESLVCNEDKRKKMGFEARKNMTKTFSWENCALEHGKLYLKLLLD